MPMLIASSVLRRCAGLAGRSALPRAIRARCLCDAAKPAAEPNVFVRIQRQVANEVATCNESPAKMFGFFGACCNWFLGLSAVYDATCKGPEVISLKMTGVMLCYSTLFGRWCVPAPRSSSREPRCLRAAAQHGSHIHPSAGRAGR
jgi:hypothetical protein